MASLSNINGLFDVHSTGAILFSTSHGTSGQILRSNGNAAPTWVAASTVIGGPYLPLTGGTLIGPLSGTSATFSGMITVNGGGIDIDNNDDVRLRFDNTGTFKAGLQVATTAGDMIAGSAVNDFAIRAQENMLFATGGNTESIRIDSSGDTHLQGNLFFEGSTSYVAGYSIRRQGANFIFTGGTTGTFFNRNGNGATDMYINASGNVGIGDTDPPYELSVKSSDTTTLNIEAGASNLSRLFFSDTTIAAGFINYNHSVDSMTFGVNTSTNAVTINSSGNSTFTGMILLDGVNQIRFLPQAGESYNEAMRIIRSSDAIGFHYGQNAYEEAFTVDKDGNSRVYHKLGIRVDGDAIPWRGTAQIPAVINLAGNGAVFTRPDYTYLSQNFYYNASDNGAVIDPGQASVIELSAGDIRFYGSTAGAANAAISLQERMRITNGGLINMGNQAGSGSGRLNLSANPTNNYQIEFFTSAGTPVGTITTSGGTTTNYNTTSSDERLKKNITNWDENVLDKFKDIKPKEFHFNYQEDLDEKQKGYIAQSEVDKFPEAYPLLYNEKAKEDRYQFNPSGMTVYLMKAIQELKAEVDKLKNK